MKARNNKQISKKPNLKMKAGRNKKKTWKQLQHPDVDHFLDDMREDERMGGIRGKSDQDLFAIDTSFDGAFGGSKKNSNKTILYDSALDSSSKSKEKGQLPLVDLDSLKCYHLLKPHTLVPDPIIQRNRIRRPGERKSIQMQAKDIKRLEKKAASKQPEPEKTKSKTTSASFDPWSTEDAKTSLDDNEWIDESVRRHNLRPRIDPSKIKKHNTSEIPAIELPHPGHSYNPSFLDHQQLLAKAAAIETEKILKEQKLIKAVAPTKCDSVDLDNIIKDEPDSEEEDDGEKDIKPKLDTPKARTRQKKRHEREEKEKQRVSQAKKADNARLNEVYRIKTLQKEIVAAEKMQKVRLAKVIEKKIAHEKFGQKKLSKHKYKELSLNPTLSDQLSGRLVATNVNSSLLVERFNSLQKRNILEPRVKTRTKRKLRLKKYQRRTAKMEWEKTGVWNGIKVL